MPLRRSEPSLRKKAARYRPIAQKLHVALLAQRNKAILGPLIEKRVLDLHRHKRHPRIEQGSRMGCIEVGAADLVDLPLILEFLEDESGLDGPWNGVVPPVELHQIETLNPEPPERAVDDLPYIGTVDAGEGVPVRHELGVYLEILQCFGAALGEHALAKTPDHLFDAGVDVGTVEGRDPRIHERSHVGDRPLGLNGTMPAGELPAPAQHARDPVARGELNGFDRHVRLSLGKGTAVTSAWRNTRFAIRLIRSLLGQLGSGQATSASVDIQSFG
ncbi:MAG: hypothetical protein K0R61_5706 [Microvirga sp.]|nr:hypothetical protein [Microvirga sp.]